MQSREPLCFEKNSQFISFLIHLPTNLTAQRPIAKLTRVEKKTAQSTKNESIYNNNYYSIQVLFIYVQT
jgi:hypothetical protein